MNPGALRLVGAFFLLDAVMFAILNLHRVMNLGMPWLAPVFMIFGIFFFVLARKRSA